MAHVHLIGVLCLLLYDTVAVQLVAKGAGDDVPHIFRSMNGVSCAQGSKHVAEGALKLYRSMPRGTVYDSSSVSKGVLCRDVGYNHTGGEDPCYPGLQVFYQSEGGREKFSRLLQSHIKDFFDNTHLTTDEAELIDSCRCVETSYARNHLNTSCSQVQQLLSYKPLHSFVSQNGLFCAEGPRGVAAGALRSYLSMPRAELYQGSALLKQSCASLGFLYTTGEDPCYPGLHMYYRNTEEKQQFTNTFKEHLRRYGKSMNVTIDEADLIDSCQCQQGSRARDHRGDACRRVPTLMDRSPQRVFLSMDKVFCGQGGRTVAYDALQRFQNMPRGRLYEDSVVIEGKTCIELGYRFNAGDDACFPGLEAFFRNAEGEQRFKGAFGAHMAEYGRLQGWTGEEATLVDSCGCPAGSSDRKLRTKFCGQVGALMSRNPQRAFVSADKRFCGQGGKQLAYDALRQFSSMPRGGLYKGATKHDNSTCLELGYNYTTGEDTCFPGLQRYYRDEREETQFLTVVREELRAFGKNYDVSIEQAELIDACACMDGSFVKNARGSTCNQVGTLLARNPQRVFLSSDKRFCAQGGRNIAYDALHLFKSMPRGALFGKSFVHEQTSCEEMGYKYHAGEDTCYPGLQASYRNEAEENKFGMLYAKALRQFGRRSNLTGHFANLVDSCKCADNSYLRMNRGSSCDQASKLDKADALYVFSSFTKTWCAQGPKYIAEDALRRFKSMPRGNLYKSTVLVSDSGSCKDFNYTYDAGEDPCYPGIQNFYHSIEEEGKFVDSYEASLRQYADSTSMAFDDASLRDSCLCAEDSIARTYQGASCARVA